MKKFYLSWGALILFGFISAQKAQGQLDSHSSAKLFYIKEKNANGLVVKASKNVSDLALTMAMGTAQKMLKNRVDIKNKLIKENVEIVVLGKSENFCDLPETRTFLHLKTFDDRNVCDLRGGNLKSFALAIVDEANILKLKEDVYAGKQDLLIHEFAHTIYDYGLTQKEINLITSEFIKLKEMGHLNIARNNHPAYLMQTENEFFAVLTSIWFNAHNYESQYHPEILKNRKSIKTESLLMYKLLNSIYGK